MGMGMSMHVSMGMGMPSMEMGMPMPTQSASVTPSPSPSHSFVQMELHMPGLYYVDNNRGCAVLNTLQPYFRVCNSDYELSGFCGSDYGNKWWRVPARELFIRARDPGDQTGCLPQGTIAKFGDQNLQPHFNTFSQFQYPLGAPATPVNQDGKSCMGMLQTLATPDTLASGSYT